MPLQIRYICSRVQLATKMFAGRLVDALILDKMVTMCSGTVTPKVVFRVGLYLTGRERTLISVFLPVPVEGVKIGEVLAAGAIRAFKGRRRLGTHFKSRCRF
jgi:hypothetical protein